jgi:hypothetical protein
MLRGKSIGLCRRRLLHFPWPVTAVLDQRLHAVLPDRFGKTQARMATVQKLLEETGHHRILLTISSQQKKGRLAQFASNLESTSTQKALMIVYWHYLEAHRPVLDHRCRFHQLRHALLLFLDEKSQQRHTTRPGGKSRQLRSRKRL